MQNHIYIYIYIYMLYLHQETSLCHCVPKNYREWSLWELYQKLMTQVHGVQGWLLCPRKTVLSEFVSTEVHPLPKVDETLAQLTGVIGNIVHPGVCPPRQLVLGPCVHIRQLVLGLPVH